MSTTTIRLAEAIQTRVAEAAKRAGFEAEAEARYARIIATGETIAWADMRDYLLAKVAGKETAPPNSRRRLG